MSVEDLLKQLKDIDTQAKTLFSAAQTAEEIETLRIQILGKKGSLTAVLRGMGGLSKEDRPKVGQQANHIRDQIGQELQNNLKRIHDSLREKEMSERIDISAPGRMQMLGKKHPLSQTAEDIQAVLSGLGFSPAVGPEIEHDFYNFEALNLPDDHPARDMQDTFYIKEKVVLRTHTSPVQIRSMLTLKDAPVRVSCFGRVFRHDHDQTHTPMFHQIEGLYVAENVTFADLKGTLQTFIEKIFSADTKIRLRPSFFPFTEPSAEVDISCFACKGTGKKKNDTCKLCKGTRWIEIMGAGMVDPEVFKSAGFDSEKYSGFAFGIGVERVAMLRYGITDIRILYENDIRFLQQFTPHC